MKCWARTARRASRGRIFWLTLEASSIATNKFPVKCGGDSQRVCGVALSWRADPAVLIQVDNMAEPDCKGGINDGITLVASALPTICGCPIANPGGVLLACRVKAGLRGW